MGWSFIRCLPVVAAVAAAGCVGSVDQGGPYRPGRNLRCGVSGAAAGPIRRLTTLQYRTAVEAMFPGVAIPDVSLIPNAVDGTFANDVQGQTVSALVIEEFSTAAQQVAEAAVANPSWMPCREGTPACRAELVRTIVGRAYRRPLREGEVTDLTSVLAAAEADFGFDEGVSILIEGILQAPQFLYLPELGDPSLDAPPGMVALQGHEVATRLSFFLWNEPPDAALMAAADRGALASAEGVRAEAERMLADPKASAALDGFFREWLRLDRLATADIDRGRFPEMTPEVRQDLEASTLAFLRYAFFEEGSMDSLFLSRRGYVNDTVAPIFGVPAPGSASLVPVALDPGQRAGILTQPGLLASSSHGLAHSPILRGVLLLDSVLCAAPPPPPADVMLVEPEDLATDDAVTTREKVENTHGTAQCAQCHDAIDGMGFTFENYDAIGRFQTTEAGQPVDPRGNLRGEEVEDAVELAGLLAADRGVETCLVTHWYRYALGREEQTEDLCQINELANELRQDEGDLQAMVLALVSSNAFRFRPVSE
ncbi:MAG: DUF1592 domain-containing protein [Sandaracinaceae bacterium]